MPRRIIGYMDPKPYTLYMPLYIPLKGDLIIGYLDPYTLGGSSGVVGLQVGL